jgi:1-acyl-sn-glycerol-3-phosphate acyltransferase
MWLPGVLDTALRTAVAWLVLPAGIVLHSLAAIAVALATHSPQRVQRVYRSFGRMCLWVGGTELRVFGAERIERGRSYVVVSNHESNWDPPCILAGLPDVNLRFVVKRQVMLLPVLGQALRLTGNVTVHRDHSAGDAGRIRSGVAALDPEVSIYFFAEGSRSRSGELGSFKKGAFATAIRHGLQILPIGIAGTRAIWQPGDVRVRKGRAALEIGDPVPVDGLSPGDRNRLRDQVHEIVAKLRADARRRLAGPGPDLG